MIYKLVNIRMWIKYYNYQMLYKIMILILTESYSCLKNQEFIMFIQINKIFKIYIK